MAFRLRQGYVRQGKNEERVTTPGRFAHKLNQYIERFGPILFGTISIEPNAIYQYGYLKQIQLDEKSAHWSFLFSHAETNELTSVRVPFFGILLTHDVEYTIEDEQKGIVTYPVFFVKAAEKPRGPSVTYYIGSESLVSDPLSCIAEFYWRSHEVGRDMKLSKPSACQINRPSASS